MYQHLLFVGFLGSDPEMRTTPGGQYVTNFNVAVSRSFKNADGTKGKETTWFHVTAWNKLAENVSAFLHKGSKVLVVGRLIPSPTNGGPTVYTRRDGTPGANFEVLAAAVTFMDTKDESASPGEELYSPEDDMEVSEDDFPF